MRRLTRRDRRGPPAPPPTARGAEAPFLFVHPLIRRSVYDAIPEAERQDAHRAAAQLLERTGAPADAVAAHLLVLPPSGDEALTRTLVETAERALERAAPDEAIR